jgi:hypothetical protein
VTSRAIGGYLPVLDVLDVLDAEVLVDFLA